MTGLAYALLGALVSSTILLLTRRTRRWDFEPYGTEQVTSGSTGWDSLTSELSARIFDSEDPHFVASETTRQVTRQFRQERVTLALDWLRRVRGLVNQSMRAHLKAARAHDDLRPAEEIRLWFDFLLFHLTSGILSLVIWVCGPPCAAKLVRYSLELAGKLHELTEHVLPPATQVAAELMNNRNEPENGNAV